MKIGSFVQDTDGNFMGRISGLGIGSIPVLLQPEVSRTGNPFFKIMADPLGDAYEIGAAFPKQKAGSTYHSVNLDSPVLAGPVNAAMFYDGATGNYNLVWDRPISPTPKIEAKVDEGIKQQEARSKQKGPSP